jgi:hypothetical protein
MHTVHSYDMNMAATRVSGGSDNNLRVAVAFAFIGLVATAFAVIWAPAIVATLALAS